VEGYGRRRRRADNGGDCRGGGRRRHGWIVSGVWTLVGGGGGLVGLLEVPRGWGFPFLVVIVRAVCNTCSSGIGTRRLPYAHRLFVRGIRVWA
jgi:hypothetical protein